MAGRRLDWASAEIAAVDPDGTIHFRPSLDEDGGTGLVVGGQAVQLAPGVSTLTPA